MPRTFLYEVPDLTGGLNESAPGLIQDNEFAQLDGWYVDGETLVTLEGNEQLAGPHSEEILNVFLYDPDASVSGDEIVLVAGPSSLAKISGTDITSLSVADGRVYPTLTARWWGVQYKNEFFACQKGNGGVKRVYGNSVMEAGLTAPATECIAVDGGAGKMVAGTYRLCYRYLNRNTGARSNWSPLSKELIQASDRCIAMSSIGVSSNPQVNARQIGATQPDGAVVYLVAQIDDNVTTTYVLNVLSPDEYGEADVDPDGNIITDIRNGAPPDQAWALEKHQERLFVLNGDGLRWSEIAYFQSFKQTSFLPVVRGTGLIAYPGNGLVIFTEKNAQILRGIIPSIQLDEFSREHGCPAGKSAAIGDGLLFWYTGVNIVVSAGDAPAILPGIERVRSTLDSIPDADKADVVGMTIPSRGWYVLSVPTSSGRRAIIYDYKEKTFVGAIEDAPQTIERILRENATQERIYAAFESDNNLYTYLTGATDDGAAQTSTFRTKNYGYDNQGMFKAVRRVNLNSPATRGSLTLRVYHDGSLVETRTGLSMNREGWKRFNLDAVGQPGMTVQVGVEFTGSAQLRLDGMQVEGTLMVGRRPQPA